MTPIFDRAVARLFKMRGRQGGLRGEQRGLLNWDWKWRLSIDLCTKCNFIWGRGGRVSARGAVAPCPLWLRHWFLGVHIKNDPNFFGAHTEWPPFPDETYTYLRSPVGIMYVTFQGFFLGGLGVPHPAKILLIPPIRHLSPFLDQGLSPQPMFVPENLKNLNTFLCQIWLLLSSKVPKKLYFVHKIAKNVLILH